MRSIFRQLLPVSAALLVPIIPFLIWGREMEGAVEAWAERRLSPPVTVCAVVGLLATDVLLPVPSSLISTLAGTRLGLLPATLASWSGMTLGAVLGFWLARVLGRPVAEWLVSPDELDRMRRRSDRYGPAVLVVSRALPVLAEAAVLLTGLNRLAWRRFLPPILVSNLGIALCYAALGDLAQRQHWVAPAAGISLALPLLLALVARRHWRV
jgi:uncharacterized membrane protein YdjX (TVP38/TMEM64 family)